MKKIAALIVGLALVGGCKTVSSEAQKELQTSAAVGVGTYNDWRTLTPAQQEQAFWAEVRALTDLDYSIMGTPIPEVFKADPYRASGK